MDAERKFKLLDEDDSGGLSKEELRDMLRLLQVARAPYTSA